MSLGPYTRRKIFEERKGICFFCKQKCVLIEKPISRVKYPQDAFTIEHIIPRYRHPADRNGNITGSCNKCNWQRSAVEAYIVNGKDFIGRIRYQKPNQFEHILPVDICGPRDQLGNFLSITSRKPKNSR